MGARVKMNPQALTSEMLLLIEAQAGDAEVFTLPGDVVAKMAQLARRGLATVSTPGAETHQPATRKATVEQAALIDAARQTVRFFSIEQREALRRALG
jgi:hypothetical protein